MISGKKCRHLNTVGVDIGGGEGKLNLIYLTTRQFLRHNPMKQSFTLIAMLLQDQADLPEAQEEN